MKGRILSFFLLVVVSTMAYAQSSLRRSEPEEEGVRSEDVETYLDKLMPYAGTSMHGVMILRHGRVIAEAYNEPFKEKYAHTLYSASKSFTALAIGLCVQDSLLNLDDKVIRFFPDEALAVSNSSLQNLTVEHLLTMQSGLPVRYTTLRRDYTYWTRALLSQQMVAEPGTLFAYDSMNTYLLSAIVQRVTGVTLYDLLKERIFNPMHIDKAEWEQSPEGVSCGGWGLWLDLEGMAKFGQLLMNRGAWNGEQLINAEWIDKMLTRHATNAGGTGYGYQIWMTSRPGTWKADGAYGQCIFIVPDKEVVIAMTQNYIEGNGLNPGSDEWLWTSQFLNKITANNPLPKSGKWDALREKMEQYHLPYTKGKVASLTHTSLYIAPVTVQLADNDLGWESITLSQHRNKGTLKLTVTTTAGKRYTITCGHGRWTTSRIKGKPLIYYNRKFQGEFSNISDAMYVAGSYGWTSSDDLYVRLHWVNWISGCRLHFCFKGSNIASLRYRPGYSSKDVIIPVLLR